MKGAVVVLVGVALLLACGVSQDEGGQDPLGSQSQALCTVSTPCPSAPSIQCSGNTCNSATGQYVTCDNVTIYCATGCVIEGTAYTTHTYNPANQCQWCDPSVSTTSWSASPPYEVSSSVCKQTARGGECGFGHCKGYPCDVDGDSSECTAGCGNGVLYCGY